ncbi:Anthranilate synthase component I [Granulibacter bethesdensis]|uniref:Anthranilate synthase component 1 n=1 Tax=Granulibacter bethesdensis TaxID=364410 RepID=A0AAN0RD00_9PROT|nr:anthranilate synthase component I [Granulibacter bethesdensis]AHJ62647.1 Anthranilate synthase component I [Granulibacter bethesdensis]
MTPPPFFPDFETVQAAYDRGEGVLVWAQAVADLETPVSAYLKLANGEPNSFLLESVEGGATRGRYSIIGLRPDLLWRCRNGQAEINRSALTDADSFTPEPDAPLDSLRRLIAETRLDIPDGLPAMAAGLVGYLGYDMVRQMEVLPTKNQTILDVPEAILGRPSLMAIFDTVKDGLTLAAPLFPRSDISARDAYERACATITAALTRLAGPLPACAMMTGVPQDGGGTIEPSSNISREDFEAGVVRAIDYIRAGDVFQVVPSQRFSTPFSLPPLALYRALRRINPAPFLYHLAFDGFAVVGSSPEIMVRLRDGEVTIRPLAGTRRRGATPQEDKALEQELLADPKERAEHLMLIDLGRNDVGRVSELGSVRVTESFVIERFSHVMHISSEVRGRLKAGLDAVDALCAGFPAGTLSGAPKVRAMEIIEELEPDRRGIYAGCIGYFAADGTMDTCIGLRTAVVKDGMMHVQAGCGVVADSDPAAEYEETRQKARALFRAAEEAIRFAAATQDALK